MKLVKELKWEALLKGVLYIALGVTALLVSEQMVKALGYLIGVVLILAGAVAMISYLLRDARQNYYHDDFAYGLLSIVLGCLVLYKVDVIISLVPFLLGLLVLISGITKLQDVIDMKRLECGNWIGMLILAVLNLVLGVVLILNPFDAVVVLFKVLGVGLIVSGATDIIVSVYFAGKVVSYKQGEAIITEIKEVEPGDTDRAEKGETVRTEAPETDAAETDTVGAVVTGAETGDREGTEVKTEAAE